MARADPGDRGLASTIMLAASGLIGGALGPFIVGAFSDAFAAQFGNESLRYAIATMIATPLVSVAFSRHGHPQIGASRCRRTSA